MVDRKITEIADRFFKLAVSEGIPVKRIVLFGSFAGGKTHEWSDIDFLVVLDDSVNSRDFNRISTHLWTLGQKIDIRIEPLTITEDEWLHDESMPIISIIREKGISLAA